MAGGTVPVLVSAFPGAAVHELPGAESPSGVAVETVPVVLPLTAPTIITGIAGGKRIGWLVLEIIGAVFDMAWSQRKANDTHLVFRKCWSGSKAERRSAHLIRRAH